MDILGRLLGGGDLRAGVPGPLDNYWYNPVGVMTDSGMRVDEDGAQKLSAWYRGRDILGTVLAMLPFPVYQSLPNDGGSEPAIDHPLYDLLHDQPNDWQDSYQWRRSQMFDLIDHGWAYNWLVPGARGFAHQLVPIEPTLVTPKQQTIRLPNGAAVAGRYLFDIRDPKTNETKTFTQDEIFYLRGASGKGILEYARTSLGTALATESYAANIFSKGTLNGGTIELPAGATLDTEAAKRMAQSFVTASKQWHMPKVLEQGATFKPNKMTPEDAQMLLSRRFTVDDIARWLGVPRQMLENSDPSFGNAEQFDESFITYSMGGWLSLFEFAVNHQLILAPKKYYAEFTRDAIARGKLIDRWNVHVAAVNAGIKTVDEARAKEGLNKRGGKADELREPQNITGKPLAPSSQPEPAPPPKKAPPDASARAQAIVIESAARLLRKEIAAVQKMAVRHAADSEAFATAVTAFYADHAELVTQTLQMSRVEADGYCAGQAAQLLTNDPTGWLAALDQWKSDDYTAGLAALALEEAA